MEGAHEDDSETWQTVGAVTARILLHLMNVDFKPPDDVDLVDNQPRHQD